MEYSFTHCFKCNNSTYLLSMTYCLTKTQIVSDTLFVKCFDKEFYTYYYNVLSSASDLHGCLNLKQIYELFKELKTIDKCKQNDVYFDVIAFGNTLKIIIKLNILNGIELSFFVLHKENMNKNHIEIVKYLMNNDEDDNDEDDNDEDNNDEDDNDEDDNDEDDEDDDTKINTFQQKYPFMITLDVDIENSSTLGMKDTAMYNLSFLSTETDINIYNKIFEEEKYVFKFHIISLHNLKYFENLTYLTIENYIDNDLYSIKHLTTIQCLQIASAFIKYDHEEYSTLYDGHALTSIDYVDSLTSLKRLSISFANNKISPDFEIKLNALSCINLTYLKLKNSCLKNESEIRKYCKTNNIELHIE